MVHHESLDTQVDSPTSEDSEERRFHYFKYPAIGAKVLEVTSEPPEASEDINEVLDSQRQGVLERFASDIEGLDIQRVDNFFDELGLRHSALIVLDKSRKRELRQYLEENIGAAPMLDEQYDHRGWYRSDLDIAFVFREQDYEEVNGPEYTEGIIVHELAHSSGKQPDARVLIQGAGEEQNLHVTLPRLGHAISRHFEDLRENKAIPDMTGTFLEEAFAEQMRTKYLTDDAGLMRGLAKLESDMIPGRIETGFEFSIPSKYFYLPDRDSDPKILTSSYPAAAMDALIAKDPELFPALIEARRSADGLREVARRINGISPGLYKTLRDDFNHADDFAKGYFHVLEMLDTDRSDG